jgi:hypothetical protein
MITELLFKRVRAGIGVMLPTVQYPVPLLVRFDSSDKETHTSGVELSDHPVEEGADVTDHIRIKPDEIELNGVISNTPLLFLASFQAESPVEGSNESTHDRVEVAYRQLREFQRSGVLVDVITSLRTYSNMVITNISISRDVHSGNILDSTISLREMTMATAMSIDVPVPVAKKAKKNAGKKQLDDAEKTTEANKSMMSTLLDEIAGGL